MRVRWKTQLPLCAAHKRTGMALSSKQITHTQTWKCVFFRFLFVFFFSMCCLKESAGLQICLCRCCRFSFRGWSESFREQRESHCHSSSVCNYCRSHCFSLKGCIHVLELRLFYMTESNEKHKQYVCVCACGCVISCIMYAYLDDFINHRTFSSYTLSGKLSPFQAIDRNTHFI